MLALAVLLVGLPWALVHFVGWPLPDHVPTWEEVEATLLDPMSNEFVINVLVVVCWIAWFRFALGVLQSVFDLVQDITWSPDRVHGPIRSAAATLVAAVLLTLVTNRALAAGSVAVTDVPTSQPQAVVATVRVMPGSVLPSDRSVVDRAASAPHGHVRVVEEVRLPHNGIYDSMWRIAERVYGPGGGARWPELFELNRGVEQADGRSLVDPDHVRPGWKIAAYIPETQAESPQQVPPPAGVVPPTETPVPAEIVPESDGGWVEPGIDLMTGVYISTGAAGVISGVLVASQMRRRRRYRIGSGERSDLERPRAPVVVALREAHRVEPNGKREERELVDLEPRAESPRVPAPLGVRRGREFVLNLASVHGLGLIGAGAAAAVRALLLHLLTTQSSAGNLRVLVPAEDLRSVFGRNDVQDMPNAVEVVASLDTALDQMETAILTRARRVLDEQETNAAVVLIASPAAHAHRRVQAVLDNGSVLGLAGILLGQWSAGATVAVQANGTVSASSQALRDKLAGIRLFTLPAPDASDLIAVLREAESDQAVPETAGVEGEHELSTSVTVTQRSRLTIKVFGRFRLSFDTVGAEARELSELLTPKQREVLVYLALHPEGVRREALNEAVWPDSRPPRPYNSFHNTLSVLRRVLSDATNGSMANVVVNALGRYQLSHEFVTVDLWQFRQTLERARAADTDRKIQLQGAVDLYEGDLAEDLSTPWIEPFREAARRDALDAYGALIHLHGKASPETVLELLERARMLDQYNEGIYRDIMRTQAQLGQYTAVPRTLALLTSVLREIDELPSPDSGDLAELLQRRGNAPVLAS
ncbi:BTAD domain-containing putative transcriptional regulator [Lentzea cavernae]|uniref:BTAD domain-containing putative transcriptional regulator n=1 Tax=Lentzea cavernae TaxID=2020703 RepID=UPI00174EBB4A|nr:BTAD domain-containing putative transcriptional regulator [Lentzea cavernae]